MRYEKTPTSQILKADDGFILTDGCTYATAVTFPPSYDTTAWHEIPADLAPREPMDKDTLLANCAAYAESLKAVDFHGEQRWLTPNERANYRNALTAAEAQGITAIPIYGITITPAQGLAILNAVELYAMKVTITEQAHEAAIRNLTEEALDGYDYTSGYPEKLVF